MSTRTVETRLASTAAQYVAPRWIDDLLAYFAQQTRALPPELLDATFADPSATAAALGVVAKQYAKQYPERMRVAPPKPIKRVW